MNNRKQYNQRKQSRLDRIEIYSYKRAVFGMEIIPH